MGGAPWGTAPHAARVGIAMYPPASGHARATSSVSTSHDPGDRLMQALNARGRAQGATRLHHRREVQKGLTLKPEKEHLNAVSRPQRECAPREAKYGTYREVLA